MQTILITVDALRADHLPQYGYDRETLPALDALAEDGTLFSNAYANGPYTRISVPSVHASRYLAYERLDSVPTVTSVLRDAGVHTACIGTRTGFQHLEGDLIYDEFVDLGRDEFHEEANASESITDRFLGATANALERVGERLTEHERLYSAGQSVYWTVFGKPFEHKGYTSAKTVTETALEWLEEQADEDFFLWIHYMEGHRPYGVHDSEHRYVDRDIDDELITELMKKAGTEPDAVTAEERELLRDLYDSDLAYCSTHLERLFDGLRELDIWEESAIAFTSDHGEEFYEHGEYFHRNLPYDELTHVPLLVKPPGSDGGDDTVDEQRELLDLAPTICRFHGVDRPASFLGTDLFEGEGRTAISVGSQLYDDPVIGVRDDGWKYITFPDDERLFDLESDPGERESIADDHPDVVADLRDRIPERLFEMEPEELRRPRDEVDKERLEALGYLEIQEQEQE